MQQYSFMTVNKYNGTICFGTVMAKGNAEVEEIMKEKCGDKCRIYYKKTTHPLYNITIVENGEQV